MEEPKAKEKFTTIYIPVTLHKRLAQTVLELSIETGKKVHIWEYIDKKTKNG